MRAELMLSENTYHNQIKKKSKLLTITEREFAETSFAHLFT